MSSTIKRKLAAIMFTDIAGYTAQMSKDEARAMELLKQKESILKPLLEEYKGTFVKSIGDGTLTYFESAINAASCAVQLQELTYEEENLNIRAGIHIGDIVFKDDDVFGDGVNISARLESMAPVGGVCVSKNVYDELMNQKGFEGVELGLQSLKGVGRLVEVYGLKGAKLKEPKPEDYKKHKVAVHKDEEVPSIAVIPFDNKGADEDVFYAYGISSDLISNISSAGTIRVASMKDIEKFKYSDMSSNQLSEKLSVRYIAQGTLWKMGEMFQLSIELYDTQKSNIIWSDRWQEKWENLTTIQSSVSDGLLQALALKTEIIEKVLSDNPEAYECYLKAIHKHSTQKTREDLLMARKLYKKAYEIDSDFIYAKISYAGTFNFEEYKEGVSMLEEILASSHVQSDKALKARALMGMAGLYFFTSHRDKTQKYNLEALKLYSEIGDKNRVADLTVNMSGALLISNSYDEGIKMSLKGIEISKELENQGSYAGANMNLAYIYSVLGKDEISLRHINIAEPILRKMGNNLFLGMIEKTKAVNYFNQKDFNNSFKYFQISDSIFSEYHGETMPPSSILEPLLVSENYSKAKEILRAKKYSHFISTDYKKENQNHDILSKILCAIVMNNNDNEGIRLGVDDYAKHSDIEKEPLFAWMFFYWAFVLLKDQKYINLSYDYLMSFLDFIPDDCKESFLKTTITELIVKAYNASNN